MKKIVLLSSLLAVLSIVFVILIFCLMNRMNNNDRSVISNDISSAGTDSNNSDDSENDNIAYREYPDEVDFYEPDCYNGEESLAEDSDIEADNSNGSDRDLYRSDGEENTDNNITHEPTVAPNVTDIPITTDRPTSKPTVKPSDVTILKPTAKPAEVTTLKPTATPIVPPTPNVTSEVVNGVTFNYVESYYYKSDNGYIIDYDISLNIEYCEPSEYMTGHDIPSQIYSATGMYNKSEIGGLYKSAGTNDFAVFKVTFNGNFIDEFSGCGFIDYRKYNKNGAILSNINGITDYEIESVYNDRGTINKTVYIGFYTSEVSRVDFKIIDVGPNGINKW